MCVSTNILQEHRLYNLPSMSSAETLKWGHSRSTFFDFLTFPTHCPNVSVFLQYLPSWTSEELNFYESVLVDDMGIFKYGMHRPDRRRRIRRLIGTDAHRRPVSSKNVLAADSRINQNHKNC